ESSVALGGWSKSGLSNPVGRLVATCTPSCSSTQIEAGTAYSLRCDGAVGRPGSVHPSTAGARATGTCITPMIWPGTACPGRTPTGTSSASPTTPPSRVTNLSSSLVDAYHPGLIASATYTAWDALNSLSNGCTGSGCVQAMETYEYNNRLQ